jgi:hypothetical protein
MKGFLAKTAIKSESLSLSLSLSHTTHIYTELSVLTIALMELSTAP